MGRAGTRGSAPWSLFNPVLRRFRPYPGSRSDLLQVANDDLVAHSDALVDDDEVALVGTRNDDALLGPAVLADPIDEPTELARTECDLWHQQRAGLVGDVNTNVDEFAG